MKFCIVVNNGSTTSSFNIEDAAVSFGRSCENDIQIPDKYLSRNHLLLWGENNRCFIKDLGSGNGTYVNGRPIRLGVTVEVKNGHAIVVGTSSIRLGTEKSGVVFAFLQAGVPLFQRISGH